MAIKVSPWLKRMENNCGGWYHIAMAMFEVRFIAQNIATLMRMDIYIFFFECLFSLQCLKNCQTFSHQTPCCQTVVAIAPGRLASLHGLGCWWRGQPLQWRIPPARWTEWEALDAWLTFWGTGARDGPSFSSMSIYIDRYKWCTFPVNSICSC